MNADLSGVMDGLAALAVTAHLAPQVYAYPVDSITVPCVIVGYPTHVEFDVTFHNGADQMTFPVWVVVGKSSTKGARDQLSATISGATTVKSTFDGAHSFGDVRVTDFSIDSITIAAVDYLAAKFDIEVI